MVSQPVNEIDENTVYIEMKESVKCVVDRCRPTTSQVSFNLNILRIFSFLIIAMLFFLTLIKSNFDE